MAIEYSKADRNIIEQENIRLSGANDKIQEFLEQQRQHWQTEFKPIMESLASRDIKDYIDIQAKQLSLRTLLTEEISIYLNKLSKDKPKHKRSVADRVEFYMHGFGLKTTDKQQRDMLDRDLAQNQRNLELLEVHIEFLRECRITCDQIGYAIKNKVAFMSYIQ